MAKGFIKGHNHSKLGLHRTGHNTYSKGGVQYKRVKGGFRAVSRHHAAYDPLAPLTGKNLSRELNSATRLKYGPQEQQLQGETRISGVQQQRIGDWYGQYQRDLASAQAATQQAYRGAQQGVYQQANQAAGQDEAARQKLNQEQAQSAAVRGTSASVAPEAQQAAQANRALSSSFGGLIGAQGAAAAGYVGSQRIAAAQQGVQAHQDESARGRQINALARQLAADKGDYRVQLRGQLRDSERTYALNQQAFGLDVSKAQAQAQHQARQDQNVRRGQNLVARSKHLDRALKLRLGKINNALKSQTLSETRRHHLEEERESILRINKPSGRGGSSGGISPAKARTYRDKWEGYVGDILAGKHPGKGTNPLLAGAALEYVHNRRRGVSARTARRIRQRFGFHLRVHRGSKHPPGAGGQPRPN